MKTKSTFKSLVYNMDKAEINKKQILCTPIIFSQIVCELWLQLTICCSTYFQVSVDFSLDKARPAENIRLTVHAYPSSYVGVLAVDKSVLLLKGGNDITQDMVSVQNS